MKGKLYAKENEQLYYSSVDGKEFEVQIVPCFPKTLPYKYLSIRDKKHKELELIEDLEHLDKSVRLLLMEYLRWNQFYFKITELESISDNFELREWKVETEQGKRNFQTKLEDWPKLESDGRVFVQGLSGDVYAIENASKLNENSKKILRPFID